MPNSNNLKCKTTIDLTRITSIDDLRSLGKFTDAKHQICKRIGLPIKARGWQSLFKLILLISKSIDDNREMLVCLASNENTLRKSGSFKDVKLNITKLTSYEIKARGWSDLRIKLNKLITPFTKENIELDKYMFYEKNKHSNFISSSILEGINITKEVSLSMEEVIKKYKVEQVNG